MAALARRRRRVAELEQENAELRAEIARLKAPRPPSKSTTPTK